MEFLSESANPPTEVWRLAKDFRRACDAARASGRRVAVVPTMGALHAGHMALVAEAGRHGDFVVVTIFVNPTQFGPNEDFARYPRNLEADAAACARAGAHGIFAPDVAEMYPPGDETRVRVGETAAALCAPHRPVHFEGVARIVTKLLVLTGPCVAVFGRKDYQQLRVIHRLVADLFLPVELVGLATVREPDGLAMSSRNAYLSTEQRAAARAIPTSLSDAVRAFAAGEQSADAIRALVRDRLAPAVTSIDYVEVADPITTRPFGSGAPLPARALCAVAVRIGGARLIDNVVLGDDPAPVGAT